MQIKDTVADAFSTVSPYYGPAAAGLDPSGGSSSSAAAGLDPSGGRKRGGASRGEQLARKRLKTHKDPIAPGT